MLERSSLALGCALALLLFPFGALAQPESSPGGSGEAPPTASSEKAELDAAPPLTASEITPLVVPESQKMAVTGTLSLRVENPDVAAKRLRVMLAALGARLLRQDNDKFSLEIDRARFSEAMKRLASLGLETEHAVGMVDRTPDYLETLASLRAAQQTRNRIGRLRRGTSGVQDPLRVEHALERWDHRISTLKRELQAIRHRTDKATIHLQLESLVSVVPENVPTFQLPFPWLLNLGPDRLLDLDAAPSKHEEHDEDWSMTSAVQMDLHLKGYRASSDAPLGERQSALSAGFTMRGVGDTDPIGFAAGMDCELGGAFSGGFLYDYRMLAGLGTGFGEYIALGLATGIGLGGVTGNHVPFGLDIPVEAFAAVEVGDLMRMSGWTRTSWILASSERQDGSNAAPFGDEFAAGGSVLFGGHHTRSREGLAINGAYRELMGYEIYEISLGIGASFLER